MTIDKLREILSYHPADANVKIKERSGHLVETDNMFITNKIEDSIISTIIIEFDWD